MKYACLVLSVLSLFYNVNLAFCESTGSSLEKQLFDQGNKLYKVSRQLATLKEDLLAAYAETPSTTQRHRLKMAVQKMVLSRRVSFLTSLSLRDITFISEAFKYDWCRGQETAIETSMKWTENDFEAIKSLLGRVDDERASTIIKKSAEEMSAAIVIYKHCNELLRRIMEQKKPTGDIKP